LRGKAKAARDERRFDLDLRKRCDERPALQPLFKRPGGILCRPRLDDEKERRVEAERRKSGPVRSPPFARGIFGEAPQDEAPALGLRGNSGDCGKGESKRGRSVAIGGGLDLVEPALLELAERKLPPPEKGRVGEGVGFRNGSRTMTSTRRWPLAIASLPLAGGGKCACWESGTKE
jgi:hypothetical protein